MTLYDSILEQIGSNATRLYEMLNQKPSVKGPAEAEIKIRIETALAKEKPVLDAALELLSGSYTEKTLETRAERILESELTALGYVRIEDMPLSKRQQFIAKKNIVREKIRFFNQVLSQEGNTDNFQEAVRLQFRDRAAYKAAVDKLIDAERAYWHIRPSYGQSRIKGISTFDAIEATLEESVKAIFGN